MARRSGRKRLILIAGRQIITQESLEVLAIGTLGEFDDGQSLEKTVELISSRGAVAILPWAFGKWWFKRGERVRDFIQKYNGERLFVGDNAGSTADDKTPPCV